MGLLGIQAKNWDRNQWWTGCNTNIKPTTTWWAAETQGCMHYDDTDMHSCCRYTLLEISFNHGQCNSHNLEAATSWAGPTNQPNNQQAGLDQRPQATTTPRFAPGWVTVTSSTSVQPSEDTATHAWKEAESYLAAPTRTTDAQAAQVAGTAAEQHQAAPHWSASRRGVVLQGASPHTTSSRRHSRVRVPLVGQPGTSCRRAPEPGPAACAVNRGVEWHWPITRMGVPHS